MNKVKKHYGYYGILLLIVGIAAFLLTRSADDAQIRMEIIVLLTFFYVVWGVLHHYINHDLTAKIVLEYVLFGSLGIALIFFLIK